MMNQLGQLIITGISGTSLEDEERKFLEEENIGGVLLFSHNYYSPAQLAELVNSIQQCRNEYPLFIAVDQEGGRVQRFKDPFLAIPSAYELSLLDSPKQCFHISKIIADELTTCGVNLNFSPVCDVWTNPNNKVIGDRAYGKDPDTVSKVVSSVIRGFQTNGLIACAKHFPGHGDTTKDSHFSLPIIKKSLEELNGLEYIPFVKAIKSRVEMVMMAHVVVDSIDPSLPTSLSKHAYDILRNEMRFTKIIVTDDMQMKAISDNHGVGEAALMAINAGADLIEYRDLAVAKEALSFLKKSKKTKQLKNEVISDRFDRIQSLKKTYLGEYKPIYIPEIAKVINSKATQTFIAEIREKIDQILGQQ
jgi:beta-N-acetylhexosaminidase